MNPIKLNQEILEICRKVIWFENPEQAVADPVRFIAYALRYATYEEIRILRKYISNDDLKEVLDHAPPGVIDPRSWAYWNNVIGRYPAPPMPLRRFG